ncbi:MAG: peptidyl-prolyl cis-trans isomerase [Planctomycetota bacterium]|nr:MAG: peptidyl-prolyl cis-trans isomerase [Planctomycetota bacterium]
MQIAQNTVATIDYTLTNDAGEVLDSSEGRGPMAYVHGVGAMIPGLEKELEGKAGGDNFDIRIAPEDAYGQRSEELIHAVPRAQLPPDAPVEPGVQFQAETPDGTHTLTVVKVEGDTVHMDANHPLAGVALNFKVDVREVREATAEEIEHGHAHGKGGQEH